MGFRRIQAADLRSWNGNAQDPQWRLLMTEITNLVSGNGAVSPPEASAAVVPPGKSPPTTHAAAAYTGRRTGLLVGPLIAVAIVVGGVVMWGFRHASQVGAASATPPAVTSTLPPPAPQAAAASAPSIAQASPAQAASAPGSVVGVWQGWYHLDTDPPDQRTPLTGTFQPDGSMIGQSAGQTSLWRWQQSGSSAQWSNGNTIYTASITGNHMVGTISYGQHTGNFEANR